MSQRNNSMRVLLWNPQPGLFFEAEDRWTTEVSSAKDFLSSHRAAVFAQERQLSNVEVLLDFGDPEYNVRLPAPPVPSFLSLEPKTEP
jgi:hypothetical protein